MYDYSYNTDFYQPSDAEVVAGILGMLGVMWLIVVALCVFLLICQWKIFSKAGQPGWKALIPFYNMWTLCQIIFGQQYGWLMFVGFASIIPVVGPIVAFAWYVYQSIQLARVYGKGGGFVVLMFFLPVIAYPVLAFGSAQYMGPQAPFFSQGNMSNQNPQWSQPQQNTWAANPNQQPPWAQANTQQQPWGQNQVPLQKDPWAASNPGATGVNPTYQQPNPANGWPAQQNPVNPGNQVPDSWGAPSAPQQTPPQMPNNNNNPFI